MERFALGSLGQRARRFVVPGPFGAPPLVIRVLRPDLCTLFLDAGHLPEALIQRIPMEASLNLQPAVDARGPTAEELDDDEALALQSHTKLVGVTVSVSETLDVPLCIQSSTGDVIEFAVLGPILARVVRTMAGRVVSLPATVDSLAARGILDDLAGAVVVDAFTNHGPEFGIDYEDRRTRSYRAINPNPECPRDDPEWVHTPAGRKRPRMRPLVLIIATVAVALSGAACRRDDRAGAPGLAIVDTSLGEVVEHWEAPALTFDVAQDPVTGRVWAVAEHERDSIPRVWELFPDAEPELRYELHPGASGPEPGGTGFFGYGKIHWAGAAAISFDPGRRRGSFASPGSDEMALLDIDSGEQLWSVYSYDWGWPIGMSFDLEQGIGYGTTIGILYSVITSSGQVADGDVCPGWSSTPAVDPVGNRVFFISGDSNISVYDPVTEACGPWVPHFCGGYSSGCTTSGLTVSGDGERLYVAAPSLWSPTPPWDGPPSFSIWDLTAGELNDKDIQTEIPDGAAPHQFALSPDDGTLYVSMLRCDRIGVYDAITGEHRYDIRTDAETMGIDLSADGTRLFVTQVRSDSALSRGPFDYVLRERAGGCPPFKKK